MRRPVLTSLLIAVTAACAHADSFDQGTLRKGDLALYIGALPPGWRRVDVEGADLAFRDDAHEGSVLFDVRCGRRDDDAPLAVLTRHLVMGTTDREVESEETLPFDGREAMHTVLRAKLDGVPMRYDIFVMKKDGCVYDMVYVASPDGFAQGAQEFERLARGVHALSSRRAALGHGPAELAGSSSDRP